jgi:DNA primase
MREAGLCAGDRGLHGRGGPGPAGLSQRGGHAGHGLHADHVQKLFRFTDAVVFSFDGDAAGRRAARKALDGALPYATDVRSVKFLFLPAEHDPDSYIREHLGRCLCPLRAGATPLSRFLIEAASEGCDLAQAPRAAPTWPANARPLWSALPDGVLKRQLLGDIAELSATARQRPGGPVEPGIGPRHAPPRPCWRQATRHAQPHPTDDSPWGAGADGAPPWQGSPDAGYDGTTAAPIPLPARPTARAETGRAKATGKARAHGKSATTAPGRPSPACRHPHGQPGGPCRTPAAVAHGVSGAPAQEDHTALCAQPAPHGPLFAWLEAQFHEHGPLPWAVLRESLRGHECEAVAVKVMTGAHAQTEGDEAELRSGPTCATSSSRNSCNTKTSSATSKPLARTGCAFARPKAVVAPGPAPNATVSSACTARRGWTLEAKPCATKKPERPHPRQYLKALEIYPSV